MPFQPQKFVRPPAGTPPPNWEENWHRGHDYIAPDHVEGTHPIETGDASFTRSTEGLNLRPESSLDADMAYATSYKQEPLPGQWLFYSGAR